MSKIIKISRLRSMWDSIKYYVGGVYKRAGKDHIFLFASSLSYSMIICIIPVILIILAIVGRVMERPYVIGQIESFIDKIIPYQDYANTIKELVFARVEEFRLNANIAGLVGFVGLFFASSGLFSAMRSVLNMVFRTKPEMNIYKGKLRDFGLILIVMAYFLLAVTIFPLLNTALEFASSIDIPPFNLRLLNMLLFNLLSFAITTLTYGIVYFSVPNKKMPIKVVLVSAITAAVLWEIAKQVFGFYLGHSINLKRIYGTYVLFVAAAVWIYYSSAVLIVGAEFGQLYDERRKGKKDKKT